MDNSQKGIEVKLAKMIADRNAKRRENRPELTAAQIEAQKESEPSDGQLTQLRRFKVPEEDIASMSKFDAGETLDQIFEEIARRNALPISKNLVAALEKWGFDALEVKRLTQGEGQQLLRKVAPPLKSTGEYVSKNPLYKSVKKKAKRA